MGGLVRVAMVGVIDGRAPRVPPIARAALQQLHAYLVLCQWKGPFAFAGEGGLSRTAMLGKLSTDYR